MPRKKPEINKKTIAYGRYRYYSRKYYANKDSSKDEELLEKFQKAALEYRLLCCNNEDEQVFELNAHSARVKASLKASIEENEQAILALTQLNYILKAKLELATEKQSQNFELGAYS